MTQCIKLNGSGSGRLIEFNGHLMQAVKPEMFYALALNYARDVLTSLPHLQKHFFPGNEKILIKTIYIAEMIMATFVSYHGDKSLGDFEIDGKVYRDIRLKRFVRKVIN